MYVICNTKGVVLSEKYQDRSAAHAKAQEVAANMNFVTVVRSIPERVTVRKTVVAKPNHQVYVALGKHRVSDNTRKVLRVGTVDEIKAYCIKFVKRSGYSPVMKIAPAGILAGQRF